MSSRVVIDPDGDIVLQLHQEQPSEGAADGKTVGKKLETWELIVSSKVLSLASPVFRVMIGGRFKESVELAEKKTSSETYNLPLPEDDADATIILCRILHFSINDVPEKPTTVCLERLAYLCDKYQCISAMKYCGGLWLRNWLLVFDNEDPSIDDLCRLLIFAYVIDLPYEFLGISWKLFLSHRGPFLGPFTQAVILVDHPLLDRKVARTALVSLCKTAADLSQERWIRKGSNVASHFIEVLWLLRTGTGKHPRKIVIALLRLSDATSTHFN